MIVFILHFEFQHYSIYYYRLFAVDQIHEHSNNRLHNFVNMTRTVKVMFN